MKKSFVVLLAAAASVALLSSTLGAKGIPRGAMHIPVVGNESFAAFYNPGTPVLDEGGNVVGVRGIVADIRWQLSMPSLGVDDLELIAHATINQDRDGLALLRMWATGEVLAGGEVVGHMTAVNIPIQLEGSLYVSLITATGVFFEGPLKGCTFSWTSRFVGGQEVNPPTYLGEIKGFLTVPKHIDIGYDVKRRCHRSRK